MKKKITVCANLKNLGIAILIVLMCSSTFATTYFVAPAPTGSDYNPGTLDLPFETVTKAYNLVLAGETIYLLGGTYNIVPLIITKSGAKGNLIKLWAYPGAHPVIDCSAQPGNSNPIKLSNASWWHIKGLEIKYGAQGGIRLDGNSGNNIIENCNIHHCGRASVYEGKGIALYGTGSNNLILNNDSHHNVDALGDHGNADGMQIATSGQGTVLRGNRVWRNSDDGFDLFNTANGTTTGNWAFENGFDDKLNPLGDGSGFKLGGVRPNTRTYSGGHTCRNNLAWKNLQAGFDDNNSSTVAPYALPDTLYNNTAWSNQDNYSFWAPVSHVFKNNINYGTYSKANGGTSNTWNLSVTVNDADFASMDDACARGPRQADGSLPDCSFLKLVAGSDLIDKGVNVNISYSGSAPDLGAYEYGSILNVAVTSVTVIKVFPNPSSGIVTVALGNSMDSEIYVYKANGSPLLNLKTYKNSEILDLRDYKGLLLIKVLSNGRQHCEKVIIR